MPFATLTNRLKVVLGLFPDRESAEKAYLEVAARGYGKDDVDLVMSDETRNLHFTGTTAGKEIELGNKAAEGAGIGAGIGGTVGAIIAGIAAVGTTLALPGLGLVIAGPLAAAAAGAGAGAAGGGLIGALIGWNIPVERVKDYEEGIKNGGILMGVHLRNDKDLLYFEQQWRDHFGGHVYKDSHEFNAAGDSAAGELLMRDYRGTGITGIRGGTMSNDGSEESAAGLRSDANVANVSSDTLSANSETQSSVRHNPNAQTDRLSDPRTSDFQGSATPISQPDLQVRSYGDVRSPQSGSKPFDVVDLSRFMNARAPQQVGLNEEGGITVQIAMQAAQSGAGVGSAPIGSFIGMLTIDVHAPGLRIIGPATLPLQVPESGDSERIRFAFRAEKPGRQQIDVMAWNGSAQIAGLSLEVAVATSPSMEGASEGEGDINMREPELGEFTLDVTLDELDRRYRFQLRSDDKAVWPPMFSEPLLDARQKNYELLVNAINAQARNLYNLSVIDQEVWLRGLGNLLFEQLVPDSLKVALLENKDHIRVLNILSDNDPTPWEVLFLSDAETGEGDFLANSTTVARWRYGAPATRILHRSNAQFVLPVGAPESAQAELMRIQALLGGGAMVDNITALNILLATGGFGILHFAAHNVNVPGASGGAYVPFGSQRWDLAFMGAVPKNKFKTTAPLVFMNACTSSGTTPLYTELASWADRFLRAGSGAFIGTLWEVRDKSARTFSEALYGELAAGNTLGAAMRAGRSAIHASNAGDPTWLAYTLYGNPLARLQ
jgi:hypothetical protein